MMPSVIPARLQFQCGHAALVTLPRVKGETATQRNDRVAREKQAALSRECDFCAPANGTPHVEVAEAVKVTPVEGLAVIVAAEPEPIAEEEAAAVVAEALAEIAEPETQAPTIPEEVVPPAATQQVNGANGTHRPLTNDVVAPRPTRKARVKRQATEMVARGQRFLVEYRLERVLRADSIHEALRQVATYGPGEVVAITRED